MFNNKIVARFYVTRRCRYSGGPIFQKSAGLENLCEVGVGESSVENINLFFQFSLVLKRHTEFQGRPLKILRREQADPAAQVKLSQVTLE